MAGTLWALHLVWKHQGCLSESSYFSTVEERGKCTCDKRYVLNQGSTDQQNGDARFSNTFNCQVQQMSNSKMLKMNKNLKIGTFDLSKFERKL